MKLGKLKEITDLRTVWPNEAADFTPWLAKDENIANLADAIGLDITVEDTESSVGDFNVDISAYETGTDRKIVIENQLGDTDHDHLGKLITYASGKSADVIIWVVKRAREEHTAAVEWLNSHTDERVSFFLCEIKLYCIGDSSPAPKFEVIEKPNDWAKEVKRVDAIATKTQQKRYDYWVAFQKYASSREQFTSEFRLRKPSMEHSLTFSIGSSSCSLDVLQIQKRNELAVELYIPDDKSLFQTFFEKKDVIEADTGIHFEWKELPNRKASRILVSRQAAFSDKEQWTEQFDWLVATLLRMKAAFIKYL